MALPKLIYVTNIMTTSKQFTDEINVYMNNFIWDQKPARIQRNVLIQNYSEGCLLHLHYGTFIRTQKLMWVQRLNQIQNSFNYAFLSQYLPTMKFNDALSLSRSPTLLHRSMPKFYHEILYPWYSFRRSPETDD